MFGASKHTIVDGNENFDGLTKLLEPFNATPDQFLGIDIVQDVLEARKRVYGEIATEGGAYDKYGRFIRMTRDTLPNSVAAQVAQSWELFLMSPILRAANITDQFTILAWLHDGCFLKFRDMRSFDYWMNKLSNIVIDNAENEGVYTSLTFTYGDKE
jgi:hypothetical protein